MRHDEEQWRPVVGFETSYEVSDQGRVRSKDRSWPQKTRSGNVYEHKKKGRVLRPGPSNYGHMSVVLGRGNTRMVHTLVLEAFVGPRPSPKHDARHINGDAKDNRLINLAWGTRSENIRDAVKHGTWFSDARVAHLKKLNDYRWREKADGTGSIMRLRD